MVPSPVPDLTSPRRLIACALVVTVVAGVLQAIMSRHLLNHGMVDTDDAMRLVMVRGLLAGHGWFNEHVARLRPPVGVTMHWSRLIDGGIAGLIVLFRAAMSRPAAEFAATAIWPVLWVFPAALAVLVIARRLGGAPAVFIGLLFLLVYQPAFFKFRPGRIDHDNVQIALFMVAFAGAMVFDRARWGAAVAGAATALMLNIGIEALPLAALLGAYLGVRLAFDPALARPVQRYGLALALGAVAVFLAQTAPALWTRSVCDQIGPNLVAGLVVAGFGLAAAGALASRLPGPAARLAALAGIGAAALLVYLGLHPSCLRGPFADIDPRLFAVWLDHVSEMRPLAAVLRTDTVTGLAFSAGPAAALVGLGAAMTSARVRRDPAWRLAAVMMAVASALMVYAIRDATYAMWVGLPVMAAAVGRLAILGRPQQLVRTAATACIASPLVATLVAVRIAVGLAGPPASHNEVGSSCTTAAAFAALAKLPPGLVVGDLDLGPFVLLYTRDTVESAPYHRFGSGILAGRAVMTADPGAARALIARGGYAYVVHCAGGKAKPPAGDGFAARLSRDEVPDWLAPISNVGGLQVYRVRWAELVGLRT